MKKHKGKITRRDEKTLLFSLGDREVVMDIATWPWNIKRGQLNAEERRMTCQNLSIGETLQNYIWPFLHAEAMPQPSITPQPSTTSEKIEPLPLAEAWTDEIGRHRYRYNHTTNDWLRLGKRSQLWRPDETRRVMDSIRMYAREIEGKPPEKEGKRRQSHWQRPIVEAHQIAQERPQLIATSRDFDTHPHLLGTPSGVYDLRSGERISADEARAAKITKSTSVAPQFAPAGRWLIFLTEVLPEDALPFVRRFLGCCMTGEITEHRSLFMSGKGRNGKNVLMDAVINVMGDYAHTTGKDFFRVTYGERHPTDIAALEGVRLAHTPEVTDARLDEARYKSLTGDQWINARRMREDARQFRRTSKTIMSGNEPPTLANVGDAMRERIVTVPFPVTFATNPDAPDAPPGAKKADMHLAQDIVREYPQILGWLIEAAGEWYREELGDLPESIIMATREYFEGQDVIGQWFEAKMCADPTGEISAKAAIESINEWCEAEGIKRITQKRLGVWLAAKGIKKERSRKGVVYCGVRVIEN